MAYKAGHIQILTDPSSLCPKKTIILLFPLCIPASFQCRRVAWSIFLPRAASFPDMDFK